MTKQQTWKYPYDQPIRDIVEAELQRQRKEIIDLIKNETVAAISPPADEWINKWKLLNKLEEA